MRLSFFAVFGIIISIVKCDASENKTVLNTVRDFLKSVRAQLSYKSSRGLDADITASAGVALRFKETIKAIFPGTLWCGDGTIAKRSDELGYFKLADACCREHDNCNDTIEAGGRHHGLENPGIFTRSNCDCDKQFRTCLKESNSFISNNIGFTYFTLLGPQCFQLAYPTVKCKKKHWFRCSAYQLNLTENPIYQWFDNQHY